MTRAELRQFCSDLYDEVYAEDVGERSIARHAAMERVLKKALELENAMIALETLDDLEVQKWRRENEQAFNNMLTAIREAAE